MVSVLHADLIWLCSMHLTDLQYLSGGQFTVLMYVPSNLFCKGGTKLLILSLFHKGALGHGD